MSAHQQVSLSQISCQCHECTQARARSEAGAIFRNWGQNWKPLDSDFREFQRIRLKRIKEMLGQLNQDSSSIHGLMVEKRTIEEFLGISTS